MEDFVTVLDPFMHLTVGRMDYHCKKCERTWEDLEEYNAHLIKGKEYWECND